MSIQFDIPACFFYGCVIASVGFQPGEGRQPTNYNVLKY